MSCSVTRLAVALGGAAVLVVAAGGCDASSSSDADTSMMTSDAGSADAVDSGTGLDAELADASKTDVDDVSHPPDAGGDVADADSTDVDADPDTSADTDVEPEPDPLPGGFGDYCDDARPCDDDHFCHHDYGVCTRECDAPGSLCPGLPAPNTYAKCLHELDDGYACAFVCVLDHDDHVHVYDCPPELSCEGTGGPGAGHQLCEY